MKKSIFIFLMMISGAVCGQEKYPYGYGRNNGSVKFSVVGGISNEDAKIMEIREYIPSCFDSTFGWYNYKCGDAVLGTVYEKITDKPVFQVSDIPAGMYTFFFRYAPQGNNVWCTECGKATVLEIVNDSKFIRINEKHE
jgi:hypothetical protein